MALGSSPVNEGQLASLRSDSLMPQVLPHVAVPYLSKPALHALVAPFTTHGAAARWLLEVCQALAGAQTGAQLVLSRLSAYLILSNASCWVSYSCTRRNARMQCTLVL